MADDIVKVRYDVQLAELQGALKQTLEPLNKIDETVAKTSKDMTEGAKKASKEYGNLASAVKETAQASKDASTANNLLNNTIKGQKKFIIDLEKELLRLDKAKDEIEKTDKQSIATINKQRKAIQDSIKEHRLGLKELALQNSNTSKSTEGLSNKTKDLTKNNGLANSTAIEFGRTLSDAPYGIRGVANNIQQLGSNFAQLKTQTGSTKLAFKALLSSFSGPLGALVLFQGAIALVDYLYGSMEKTEEATKEFTNAVSAQSLELRSLASVYQDSNANLEVRKEAFKRLQEELPVLNGLEYDNADAVSAVNDAVEKNITLAIKRGLVSKNMETLIELEGELLDLQDERIDKQLLIDSQQKGIQDAYAINAEVTKREGEIQLERLLLQGKINGLQKQAIELENALGFNSDKNNIKDKKAKTEKIKFYDDINQKEIEQLEFLEDQIDKELSLETNGFEQEQALLIKQGIEKLRIEEENRAALDAQREKNIDLRGKQIDKETELEAAAYKKREEIQRAALQKQYEKYAALGIAIGENFDIIFSDQEDKQKEFFKATLATLLTALQNELRLLYVSIIAKSVANTGVPVGGIIKVAALEAAFAAAKAGIQNFHDGSEFVTGERGRDKIPAMIEYGERVVPTATNNLLGGIPNNELPKAVEYYNRMKGKGFAENLNGSLSLNAALDDKGIIGGTSGIKNEIRGLRKDLRRNRNSRNGF